jgi:hypothetical protein
MVPAATVAEALLVSERRVRQLVAEGVIVPGPRGLYPFGLAIREYVSWRYGRERLSERAWLRESEIRFPVRGEGPGQRLGSLRQRPVCMQEIRGPSALQTDPDRGFKLPPPAAY